jgi:hypothetical protein
VQPSYEVLVLLIPNCLAYGLKNLEINKEHWLNIDEEDYSYIEEQADESESNSEDDISDTHSHF